jgi:pantoate--beta-alanine ligase
MAATSRALRAEGKRIAFVPTMGYLHEGHLSLLREGRKRGEALVLSIFVNPMQFGPTEDLGRYPRDEAGDLAKAESCGVDLAFLPDAAEMYPPGFQTRVQVTELERGLCGERRPGHFVGVATVVLKLCNLVAPDVMLLGEKDYQQLQVLRRMARDLSLGVAVVGMPIVREADGLAMSSRNAYLSTDERRRALGLSRGLTAARELWGRGERTASALEGAVQRSLADAGEGAPGLIRPDYVELRDAETLERVTDAVVAGRKVVLAVAAFVGKTRLIDNTVLG